MSSFSFAAVADDATAITRLPEAFQERVLLREFLSLGDNSIKATLREKRLSGDNALNNIVDAILEVYQDNRASTQDRVLWALELLLRASMRTGPQLSEQGRAQLRPKMQLLLRRYAHPSQRQEKILSVYTMLGLWSHADLWYLGSKVSSLEGLQTHHAYLQSIIAELTTEERARVASHVRQMKGSGHLLQYTTLFELGEVRPNDYVELFRLYAEKFSEAFLHHALMQKYLPRYENHVFRPDFEDARIMDYYDKVLQHLMFALEAKDPVVVTAFEEAEKRALKSGAKDARKQFANLFFSLISAQEKEIFTTDKIRSMAENSMHQGEFVLPRVIPRLAIETGKVIRVDFRAGRAACPMIHKK